jgi:hypothetical protein
MTYILPFATDQEVEDFVSREFTERLKLPVPKFSYFDDCKQYYDYTETLPNYKVLPLRGDWPYRIQKYDDYFRPTNGLLPYTVIPYAEEIMVIRPPVYVYRNGQGNIHCENDYAIKWRSGHGICVLNDNKVETFRSLCND